jgi:hypothetical protein
MHRLRDRVRRADPYLGIPENRPFLVIHIQAVLRHPRALESMPQHLPGANERVRRYDGPTWNHAAEARPDRAACWLAGPTETPPLMRGRSIPTAER